MRLVAYSLTQFLDDTRQIVPRRATAYTRGMGGWWQVEMSNWDQVGDGAVQTTVEDLAKWDANFYTPTVGDSALVAMLSTRARTSLAVYPDSDKVGIFSSDDKTRLLVPRSAGVDYWQGEL